MKMLFYCAIGVLFFVAVLVFKIALNGQRMKWSQGQVIGLVLVFIFTVIAWPLCVIAFSYGLGQRIK